MSIQNIFIPHLFHEWQWTRYLYIKPHVFYSLFHSMIQTRIYESLFWAYELYYSGFQDELLVFLNQLYREHFYKKESKFTAYWEKKQLDYKTNETILATLIVNCVKSIVENKNKKRIYIVYQDKDISNYKTMEASDEIRAYRILHYKCLYSSVKTIDETYKSYLCLHPYSQMMTENDFKYLLYVYRTQSQWLYYCSNTPIWRKRIEEYGGIVNANTYQIEFQKDEREEEFFQLYGYEPDEQRYIVQQNTIIY